MPTVLRTGPYRFYFYSHKPNEPPHVHADRDDLSAKFWLVPVSLVHNRGFGERVAEVRIIGGRTPSRAIGGLGWVLQHPMNA